jgi:site-specific DNA-methyltransferase (adenine-specific)
MRPGAVFYIWHQEKIYSTIRKACEENGWNVKQVLIWAKNTFVPGMQDYQWKHEPCLYGWKDGAAHYFLNSRKQTTVIEDPAPDFRSMKKDELLELVEKIFDEERTPSTVIHEAKPMRSDLHPTMKPIKLIARLIRNSSEPGQTVLDLFGGSGTTLIACEQMERRCCMMEFDPHYADVIVDRWEKMTGLKALKVNGYTIGGGYLKTA